MPLTKLQDDECNTVAHPPHVENKVLNPLFSTKYKDLFGMDSVYDNNIGETISNMIDILRCQK